ncbi:MAG: hypothetical protein H7Y38_11765, partial [Armatimonadetes bacterium]|nr:hypothetical protein [Armatimonadota bacterium]
SVSGAAANYTYKVAYRGVRVDDEGAASPEQTVAAGGWARTLNGLRGVV